MATKPCDCCGGSGRVDEGTPEERECPFCWGIGYVEDDEDEEHDDD